MRILSFNVRGLGSKVKWRVIRDLIAREKVDLACFQEVKLDTLNPRVCHQIWGDVDCDWVFSPAVNRGGGLLCLWKKGTLAVQDCVIEPGFISINCLWGESAIECSILNIYAPCDIEGKRRLWVSLLEWRNRAVNQTWCLLGDFNAVRSLEERKGASAESYLNRMDIDSFNEFINNMELVETPFIGRNFTWYRPNGTTMSRLDRVLVSPDWLSQWPSCVQEILNRDISDHCPVLL